MTVTLAVSLFDPASLRYRMAEFVVVFVNMLALLYQLFVLHSSIAVTQDECLFYAELNCALIK